MPKKHSPEILALDHGLADAYRDAASAVVAGGTVRGGVAVIAMHGFISARESLYGYGAALSQARIRERLMSAVADDAIAAIVLHIDSPGGVAAGTQELASDIRAAAAIKPVVAIADSLAASAAYWLASQATQIVVTPSGSVGSVGVILRHVSYAGELDQAGIDVTLMTAGKHKKIANPYEALSDEDRAILQADLDEVYAAFVADVARGRGVSANAVRSGFGEGRVVLAKEALALGMVDKVETTAAAIARIAANPSRIKGRRASDSTTAIDALELADDIVAVLSPTEEVPSDENAVPADPDEVASAAAVRAASRRAAAALRLRLA